MTLILPDPNLITDNNLRLISLYRSNPVMAANKLLIRNGKPVWLPLIQQKVLWEWWNSNFAILTASRGYGKCQDLESSVLTPKGFVKFKYLNAGDEVITPKGSITKIIEIFDHKKVNFYKITFEDGRSIKACEDHLWNVKGCEFDSNWHTKTTKEIKKFLDVNNLNSHSRNIVIPLVENIFVNKPVDLPIDPYVFGFYLGNKDRLSNQIISKSFFKSCFKDITQYHKKSFEKYIPDLYLNLPREQTLNLIQGFLDSNGVVSNEGYITFDTHSRTIAKQLQTLMWKLGAICKLSSFEQSSTYKLKIYYDNLSELFKCSSKLLKVKSIENKFTKTQGLSIKSIEPISPQAGRCISIADNDRLYVTDNYVVTHNTFCAALYLTLRLMLYPGSQICIFAPSFRQSKLIFAEFQKFYYESPFLQACMAKEPSIQTDRAIAQTKRVGKVLPSTLKALPVGNDGSKIRGERAQLILMDEIAQLPEYIYSAAIRPILSTDKDPQEAVMLMNELIKIYGSKDKIPQNAFINTNSYVGITSGYYQFNYWWKNIVTFYHNIKAGNKDYNLNFVPYTDLPPGFLKDNVIEDARQNDPEHIFKTEWCAEWVGDSAGAFPMSLLQSCRSKDVIPEEFGDTSGKSKYVFGVDVARDRDATAIVVIKLGYPNKLVHIAELEETPFPEQAQHLLDLFAKFKPIRIYMDAGGGGTSLKDYFLDPQSVGRSPSLKLIEIEALAGTSGHRVLQLIKFSPTIWSEVNNNTKSLLENKALLMPDSTNPIETERSISTRKKEKKPVDLVEIMLNQIACIVITPNRGGSLHYDLPKNSGSSGHSGKSNLKVRRKDLYTAFVLAGACAYELSFKHIEERRLVDVGVILERDLKTSSIKNTSINTIDNSNYKPNRSAIAPEDFPTNVSKKTIVPTGGVIITGKNKDYRRRRDYGKKRRR